MISIIVPVYNAEKYIERCLDSIFSQTYRDYEIIVVNDGSTDRTEEILQQYRTDERIQYFSQQNQGQASARNIGLERSRGEYISFVDADDIIQETFLEVMMGYAQKYSADIVQCNFQSGHECVFIDGKVSKHVKIYSGPEFLREYFNPRIPGIGGVLWNKIYHRKVFDGIRFPNGRIHEDVAVLYQLIYRASKVVYTNSELYYYFLSHDSTMRNKFSLKRMDWMTAFKEKLFFLQEHQERELYERSLQEYIAVGLKLYYCLEKEMPDEEKHIQYTLEEIKKYRKEAFKSREISVFVKMLFCVSVVNPYFAGFLCNRVI